MPELIWLVLALVVAGGLFGVSGYIGGELATWVHGWWRQRRLRRYAAQWDRLRARDQLALRRMRATVRLADRPDRW
jgi:hypothetical protein